MALPNIFTKSVADQVVQRINQLSPDTKGKWGKMSVSQMLAHCNVTYEMIYTDMHPKPNAFVKIIMKLFIKSKVVSETPYEQDGQTAPQFIIKETKDFDAEKKRLVAYISQTQELGEDSFEGKESHAFGALNKAEWNNMLYKHINHHLNQFGV